MSKKNLLLGGLLVALLIFSWIWSGPVKEIKQSNIEKNDVFSTLSLSQVEKILVDKAGQKIELDRADNNWSIAGQKNFGVDKTAAGSLNSALSGMSIAQIEKVSANAEKKSSFGTDSQGIKVQIFQGGKTFDLIVGKNTADYSGTYFSLANSDATYQINSDLNNLFGKEDWRDLAIFSFLKERATKVRFQYPGRQFTVENKNNKWAGTKPTAFKVADDKVMTVLGALENLTAIKIPEQKFAGTGLEKSSVIIQVVGEGLDNTIMIGNCTKDNLCYAKRADSDNIYLISKAIRDSLNKKSTDLK